MLFKLPIALTVLLATAANAHFRIPFPGERNASNFDTQTTGPCGGDNSVVLPRYEWNIEGSPLEINMHHKVAVSAVYFCPGEDCTTSEDFEYLVYEPIDFGSSGNFCISALTLPEEFNVVNQTGVIQVVSGGTSDVYGEYTFMYNCVDIVVSEDGPTYDGTQCTNSSTVEFDPLVDEAFAGSGLVELESVSTFENLDAYYSSTSAAVAASSSVSDDMAGMNMGTTSATAGQTHDMSGMQMSSATVSASSFAASSTGASSSSAGGATNNAVVGYGAIAGLVGLLLL